MTEACQLCIPADIVAQEALAYARYENSPLGPGHIIVVPRRHVADFFDMTIEEKHAVIALLDQARVLVGSKLRPDGYNIGVNVGRAAGQARLHVHVHLIPRFNGDVANPSGGIRCVLPKKT